MASVMGSTSTKTGVSPNWTNGQTVVGQARAGTRTSSPACHGAAERDRRSIRSTVSRLAEDPELTITACLAPTQAAKLFSNRCTSGPMVSNPESKTDFAAAISSAARVFAANGYAVIQASGAVGELMDEAS